MTNKHNKVTHSIYRPNFKIFQYVKLEGVKTGEEQVETERFTSPLFGTRVPDKIVIPEYEDVLGDNTKRLDPFRDEKKITDEENIAKYGTKYPEFGVISNQTRIDVLGGIIEDDAEIIPSIDEEELQEELVVPLADELVYEEEDEQIYLTPQEADDLEEETLDNFEDEEPAVGAIKSKAVFESSLSDEDEEEEIVPIPKEEVKVTQTVKPKQPKAKYILPDPTIFSQSNLDSEQKPDWVLKNIDIINQTLEDFGVEGEVSGSTKGPTVTRYELRLNPGINVKRVENISDTLMMNLASKSLRIEAPIPGKPYVGIEIPNEVPEVVPFGNVVNDPKFLKTKEKPLLIALGVDIDGENVFVDIHNMPHGLIAGATASGKSVCVNTFLASLLVKNSPEDLKLILIDPKYVELIAYNDLPHLLTPVITDAKMAAQALDWVVNEMERRYILLAKNQSKDLATFNEKVRTKRISEEKLPLIVVIIDELADLMSVASQEVEMSIQRITQKARAAGIHLIVATQRPSTNVIKGTIKSNIPSRIAFRVASFVDSTTIIDSSGAETLLGKGDMLLKLTDETKRLQGAYIADEELYELIDFIKAQRDPEYAFLHTDLERKIELSNNPKDELFEAVAYFVVENGSASTNSVSQNFSVGFNRAQAILSMLEDYGIISKLKGTRARDVLVTMSELEEILNNEEN